MVGRTSGGVMFMPSTLGSQLGLPALWRTKVHLLVYVAMDIFVLTAQWVHLEGFPLRRYR